MQTQRGKCKYPLRSGVLCNHPTVWHSYYCEAHDKTCHRYIHPWTVWAVGLGISALLAAVLLVMFSCAGSP